MPGATQRSLVSGPLGRRRQQTVVADVMLTGPAVHRPWTTVRELREFFEDDHVHLAVIVYAGRLLGVVERADVDAASEDEMTALTVASLDGKTVSPSAPLAETCETMREAGRRRLAVTTDDSTLVGLLCLKASGRGFCSDEDVAARRQAARSSGQITTSSRRA